MEAIVDPNECKLRLMKAITVPTFPQKDDPTK
jgi:hypothetical protein